MLHAAREFLSPLFGSSLATIIIFVPLAFLTGVTGAFFKFLSLTMASALVISFVLTALHGAAAGARHASISTRWHDPGAWPGNLAAARRTARILRASVRASAAGSWPASRCWSAVGYLAYAQVGTGFLPRMDEGGFVIDYQTAPGTSLTETNRELEQVEAILKQDPYVETYSRRTGAGLGGDLDESYQGDFFVQLIAPSKRPPIWNVMDEITAKITDRGARHRASTPTSCWAT